MKKKKKEKADAGGHTVWPAELLDAAAEVLFGCASTGLLLQPHMPPTLSLPFAAVASGQSSKRKHEAAATGPDPLRGAAKRNNSHPVAVKLAS